MFGHVDASRVRVRAVDLARSRKPQGAVTSYMIQKMICKTLRSHILPKLQRDPTGG